MKKTTLWVGRIGFMLCGALLGCAAYGQSSVVVGVNVEQPVMTIRAESDFYEPLTPYGVWVDVGSYGRCWRPGRIESSWRPYCNGYWQLTDAGWYWYSDEPWAWATYHYGRWDLSPQFGWYWIPQTQWAPAWVSWHSGGGYIGWAPLHPAGVTAISPRAYVFVQERRFLEPVRPSSVVANTTVIIKKTVINRAPATAAVEKASGRKVKTLPVQQLRHQAEAAVIGKQRTPTPAGEKARQPAVRPLVQPGDRKALAAPTPGRVDKPAATATHESAAPLPKNSPAQSGLHKADSEANRPGADREPQRALPPAGEKPAAREKSESGPGEKKP